MMALTDRCERENLLAVTIGLRDKFRRYAPESLRLPILEKDVLRQCRELGVPYVE